MKKKAKRRKYSVPEKHQRKIARSTLRMATPMVGVMGGMTKEEAREVLRRRNIARKADLGIADPFIQAKMTFPGFHSEYDEPEDFPQYPMAGDLQKRMTSPSEWKRLQASRVRMYGRKAMNPKEYWRPKHQRMEERGAYVEDDYDAPEVEQCPMCGGEAQFMGTLGKTDWFRCRQCGMDSRRQSNPLTEQEISALRREYNTLRYEVFPLREKYERLEDKWFGESAPLSVPLKIQEKMELLMEEIRAKDKRVRELKQMILDAGGKI